MYSSSTVKTGAHVTLQETVVICAFKRHLYRIQTVDANGLLAFIAHMCTVRRLVLAFSVHVTTKNETRAIRQLSRSAALSQLVVIV